MNHNGTINVTAQGHEKLREYLLAHPMVILENFQTSTSPKITFKRNNWTRQLYCANPDVGETYGLIEIMDNNPLVCADSASTPGKAATLALIALAPLIKAGIILEQPSAVFSFEGDYNEVEKSLALMGWNQGIVCAGDPIQNQQILAATVLAAIRMPKDTSELDDLFEESYARSFFIRRGKPQDNWQETLKHQPFAVYSFHPIEPSEETILRINVLSDAEGKAGSAQMVHMLNIMAGFEEDAGLNIPLAQNQTT